MPESANQVVVWRQVNRVWEKRSLVWREDLGGFYEVTEGEIVRGWGQPLTPR